MNLLTLHEQVKELFSKNGRRQHLPIRRQHQEQNAPEIALPTPQGIQ